MGVSFQMMQLEESGLAAALPARVDVVQRLRGALLLSKIFHQALDSTLVHVVESDDSPPLSIRRAGAGPPGSPAPSTGSPVEFAALARVGNASFLANVLATEVLFSSERVVSAAAEGEVLLGR
jgi:hypothetical protein